MNHPAGTPAHVEGDTIRLHRDAVVLEIPELPKFDRIEVAVYRLDKGSLARKILGTGTLAPELYIRAGGDLNFSDLAIHSDNLFSPYKISATPFAATAHWPEEYSDPDIYTVYGNASEVSSRINVVIVPDGYTYAQKATMQSHAQALVTYFRGKTPYKEHDPFMNYILVYLYATTTGTDQCDCTVPRVDTPINTGFPNDGDVCGGSGNRCLYYGAACDTGDYMTNLTQAEMRAPAKDISLVMVNTSRYGGCGGDRAVYSAAYSGSCPATDIAVHELGHSLANLGDEYTSYTGCGPSAGEINTSLNSTNGAWPEWIADIGAPKLGAEYYTQCVYRPESNCEMRALCVAFCRVCDQQWSLTTFGHFRVNPTAPISGMNPTSPVTTQIMLPTPFTALTRLSTGTNITNSFTWTIQGPGYPTPTVVSTGSASYTHSFAQTGQYTLACEVIADTNFVKPSKTGVNRDVATWTVNSVAVPEVSAASPKYLTASKNGTNVNVIFENTGSLHYNLYVSNQKNTNPFLVASSTNGKRSCSLTGLTPAGTGMLQLSNYSLETGITGSTTSLFFLVTADNGATTEGPLGYQTGAIARTADAYCAH